MNVTLREALAVSKVAKIDREKCVVYGVRVCGVHSQNGKKYAKKALREARKLYDGATVYFDHPDGESNARKYGERFGRLMNVREAADHSGAIDADLHYNPEHMQCEKFLWDAENDPARMGLSHNANGNGRRMSDGTILVEQITKVHSVDIVDNPATNFSLFEQEGFDMPDTAPLTDPAAPAASTGGTSDVDAQIAQIISDIAAHPELSKAEKKKKLQQALDLMTDDAHAPAGKGEGKDGDGDGEKGEGESEPSDEEMMEQLGAFRSPAVTKARRILLTDARRKLAASKGLVGEVITGTFLEQLVNADEKGALKLIEDRREVYNAAKAEKPTTGAGSGSGRKAPQTPAEYAASIDWNN